MQRRCRYYANAMAMNIRASLKIETSCTLCSVTLWSPNLHRELIAAVFRV